MELDDITTRKSRFYRYEVKKAITLAGETKQILKLHVKHLNDLVNSCENELLQSLSSFEDECNLYIEEVQMNQKEHQVYKEQILSANEAMEKGIEELVIMVTLMKSPTIISKEEVFPFNWNFADTPLKFEPEDSLDIGYLSIMGTMAGRKRNSICDKAVQVSLENLQLDLTLRTHAQAMVAKSRENDYCKQIILAKSSENEHLQELHKQAILAKIK